MTLLKVLSELNPPEVSDLRHTTTSISADQMIQFARTVGLEVSLASYGLLEDFQLRARSVRNLGFRGQPGRSLFPSVIGSAVGDSVASQSRCSLPTTSGFTGTAADEDADQTVEIQQSVFTGNVVESELAEAVSTALGEVDVPLAALSRELRVKSRMKEDLFKLSREGRSNSICVGGGDQGGWVFMEENLQRVPWSKLFASGPENPLENRHSFFCMICKDNVSMRSRGIYEIVRHYQSAGDLRQDQRYRERFQF